MEENKLANLCQNEGKCHFLENLHAVKWMKIAEEKKKQECMWLMPHIGENLRVNFCPTCGANIRDVQVTEKEANGLLVSF